MDKQASPSLRSPPTVDIIHHPSFTLPTPLSSSRPRSLDQAGLSNAYLLFLLYLVFSPSLVSVLATFLLHPLPSPFSTRSPTFSCPPRLHIHTALVLPSLPEIASNPPLKSSNRSPSCQIVLLPAAPPSCHLRVLSRNVNYSRIYLYVS